MGSNSVQGDRVINISDLIASMTQQISEPPRLWSKGAGQRSCSIYRVSQSLVKINPGIYKPDIVSIGPYHHRSEQRLEMIQEQKWRYLGHLISRTRSKGLDLEDYLKAIQPLEAEARECYSDTIGLDSEEFIKMMVLDGCFIIELFRKVHNPVKIVLDEEPIFSTPQICPSLMMDFLKLENQIPFFILECLFDLSKMPGEESRTPFAMLALKFFSHAFERLEEVMKKRGHSYNNLKGKHKHLLDLIRSTFIPQDGQGMSTTTTTTSASQHHHMIQCVSKLRKSGIKIRDGKADSFLTVKFRKGVIEMPSIIIDDIMPILLSNCVAFEQCHNYCSSHFTTYATLLDCLINTSNDVEYLCRHNIIVNYLGSDEEVAHFINGLCRDVPFHIPTCYLSKLFKDVHDYSRNKLHLQWAGFKYTYFNTPWSFISALAALILILLALAQTFFTIFAYFHPPQS